MENETWLSLMLMASLLSTEQQRYLRMNPMDQRMYSYNDGLNFGLDQLAQLLERLEPPKEIAEETDDEP